MIQSSILKFVHILAVLFITTNAVTLENGYYNDLKVYIAVNIDDSKCDIYSETIQAFLNEASLFLNTATTHRLAIGSAVVVIPPPTINNDCTKSLDNCSTADFEANADIVIGNTDSVFGDTPFTQQPRQCGLPGDFIYFSEAFLTENNDNTKARLFTHEWAKYRWGVFEEYGHAGDDIYPLQYLNVNNTLEDNGCYSNSSKFWNTMKEMETCKENGLSCADNLLIEEPISSLLSDPLKSSITEFCGLTNHDNVAPTKQNVLCDRKSAWHQMWRHPDFSLPINIINSLPVVSVTYCTEPSTKQNSKNNVQRILHSRSKKKSGFLPFADPVVPIIDLWASQDFNALSYSYTTAPAIFAQITASGRFILGASVELKVNSVTPDTYVYLRDSGTGADVTGNDGIYSGFLVGIQNPGNYIVTVTSLATSVGDSVFYMPDLTVNSTYASCCGSAINYPEDAAFDKVDLKEATQTQNITISSLIPDLPPSRIIDLKAVDEEDGDVKLNFTIPGQNLDQGDTPSVYHAYYTVGNSKLLATIDLLSSNLTTAGEMYNEVFPISFSCNDVVSFMVLSEDDDGNTSPDSNIARVLVTCNSGGGSSGGSTDDSLSGGEIAAIVIGSILGVLLIAGCIYLCLTRDERDANWLWGIIMCKLCRPGDHSDC